MNKVILTGRLTRDPDVRYTTAENPQAVARYTLAVDRRFKREGQQTADFIPCIAFGKQGEFANKYLRQGIKISVVGRIQTGSYTNREGQKVYTTDVVIEEQEFAESKKSAEANGQTPEPKDPEPPTQTVGDEGFMTIPEGIEDTLPFLT